MEQLFTVDIIDNDLGGHDDLLFTFPGLTERKVLDTYYFCLAIEPIESIDLVKQAVSQLLQFWYNKLIESNYGETLYLPIDFSDQYTGCLKVQKQEQQLILTYGFSRREGYSVDPLNPEDFYKENNDFEPTSAKQIIVNDSAFLFTLNKQIETLKG